MANSEKKMIEDFTKFLSNLSKQSTSQTSTQKEILALTNKQLNALKSLLDKPAGDTFGIGDMSSSVFKSKKDEIEYEKKMIALEEERAELSEDSLEKELDMLEDKIKGVDKLQKEEDKLQEKKARNARLVKETKNFVSDTMGLVADVVGVSNPLTVFGNIFSGLKSQFGGILGAVGGIGSGLGLKKKEADELVKEQSLGLQTETNELLNQLVDNTTEKKDMLKGGSMLDFLKKFIPSGLAGMFSPKGTFGKMGGTLLKGAGAAMILGGVWMVVDDFIEGFNKGGISGGLSKALLGETTGKMEDSFKNAGKFALIGAGIGAFFGPIGVLAGGLIGGAIGLLANYIGSLIKSTDKSTGEKIGDALFGGSSGIKSALFHGAKFAGIGVGIGFVAGGPIGAIVGGLIGFVVGFVINFVKQILPDDLKTSMSAFFIKTGRWIKNAGIRMWEGFKNVLSFMWEGFKNNLSSIWSGIESIGHIFKRLGNKIWEGVLWISDKLGISGYLERIKNGFIMMKDKTLSFVESIFTEISNLWDSFKNVMDGYWNRIKGFFDFGGDDKKPTEKRKAFKKMSFGGIGSGSISANKIPEANSVTELKEEKNSTKIIEKQDVMKDVLGNAKTHIKNIEEFLINDMIDNIRKMFSENINHLITQMKIMQFEDRQWRTFLDTGTLSTFGSSYKSFAREVGDMGANRREREEIGSAINSVNNVNNSVFQNVQTTETYNSLRKG